ncbi:MAG TPA: phospho-N-acetylmuramoyl-pentapeptide-transferase, partial [Aeromicrobium sp.]|nr:phospho-N-acetylmuramoyl-pentapeptide-transferase [Aeromicrobium sp.]
MLAILIAGAVALLGTLLGTRVAISILVSKGYGQLIRDDGPTSHHIKRGTPTMGGTVIIFAVLLGYAVAKMATGFAPSASA